MASVGPPEPIATGFLAALDDRERSDLLKRGGRRRYRRGAVVFHEGGGSDEIVVVLAGRVKVSTVTADGKEVVLAFRGPGDLLGELSAIDGEARSATVGALEAVEAAIVTANDFRAFLSAHPRVAILLLEMLARRLRDADRKRVEFGAHDTLGRVAARLVELAERYGEPVTDGVRITLPLSQEELAGWTGSSREAVGKALHALRGLGWVRTERRRITVLEMEPLRRRSM
jgi:CRP/FNR family transcriptional regulator, cyclic AMP receptor protein